MAQAVGTIGLGASLAGGVLSAFGAQSEGTATQQMYNYKAQVARINADINKQNAEWAREKGDIEGQQYGLAAAQRQGKIRVAQAASNLDVNSGTAKRVQESQRQITTMDLEQIRANATRVAYGYDVAAQQDLNQAQLDELAGRNAKKAGTLKMLGSLIGTASGVSDKWLLGKSKGLWGAA